MNDKKEAAAKKKAEDNAEKKRKAKEEKKAKEAAAKAKAKEKKVPQLLHRITARVHGDDFFDYCDIFAIICLFSHDFFKIDCFGRLDGF